MNKTSTSPAVVPEASGGNTGQTGVAHNSEGHEGEKSPDNMIAINTNLGPAYITTESAVRSDHTKSDQTEMVFTVVAVDDGEPFNNSNLPKEVQLSIMPTTQAGGGTSTSDIQFTNTQNTGGLFNQLALIASAMPQSTGEVSAQEQEPAQIAGEMNHDQGTYHDNENQPGPKIQPKKVGNARKTAVKYTSTEDKQGKKMRVKCNVCNQDFSDLPSMRRHRLIHSDEKPYQCEFCEKAFRRKDNLREHRNIHTQENVYTCEHCGKTFPRKYTHKVHMAKFCTREKIQAEAGETGGVESEIDGDGPSEPACIIPRVSSRALNSSSTKCSDPCPICNKTFRDTSTLKRHLLTHSDQRPFKCGECNKAFRRKDHLMEHIIVHKEVRPFTCLECGKSFSRKNGLKTHMMRTSHGMVHLAQSTQEPQFQPQEKSDSDIEAVLTSAGPFLKNISDNEHIHDTILGETPQSCEATTSGNVASCEFPENTQSSRSLAPNAEDTMETETTVVLDEKNGQDSSEIITTGVMQKETSCFMEMSSAGGDVENHDRANPWVSGSYHEGAQILGEDGSALRCPNCPKAFNGKKELWQHFQEHLGDDLFGCEHCFMTFTMPEDVEEHQKSCVHVVDRITQDSEESHGDVVGTSGDNTSDGEGSKVVVREADEGDSVVGVKGARNCLVCNKSFRDSTALKRHSLVHSGERPHACDQCGKRFRRRDHLKSHVIAYHLVSTTFQCKTCQMVFKTRYCLTTHSKTCRKPPTRAQSIVAMDMAKPTQTVAESICCPICNKAFKDSSSQRRHLRTHSEERPFPCTMCTKSFRRKDNLKEHMLCHSDHKPFSCEDCGKALSRRSSLTNHRTICAMRRVATTMATSANQQIPHNPGNIIIPDNQLSLPENHSNETTEATQAITIATTLSEVETLTGSSTLEDNEPLPEDHANAFPDVPSDTLHIPASGVSSDVNGSSVGILEGMQDEVGNEEDVGYSEKGFPCNLCGKIFRAKWTLKYHQRIHSGEKPYTCLTCDRHFRQPSHLKIHMRTHSGERPYVCEACGRAFIDSSTMRRHARVHKDGVDFSDVVDDVNPSEDVCTDDRQSGIPHSGDVIHDMRATDDVSEAGHQSGGAVERVASRIEMGDGSSLMGDTSQPISTAAVPDISQSNDTNVVHVVGHLSSSDGSKIETLTSVNWQTANVQDNVGQVTYYIVSDEKEATADKQDSFGNMSF